MAYPLNTNDVLQYMGYAPLADFNFETRQRTLEWLHTDTQPTDAAVTAASAEPAFTTWQQEHGGDPVKTLRRQAREALSAQRAEDLRTRAALVEIIKEFNRHANKINEVLDAVDAATSLADLKTRIGAIADYPQRTPAQLQALVSAAIDAGEAD